MDRLFVDYTLSQLQAIHDGVKGEGVRQVLLVCENGAATGRLDHHNPDKLGSGSADVRAIT
jgi:hypothetical protein